ncbi:helix-turn-helix domain-containing protein [Azospirillum formosense]|uniref:helix-turn-helix domain-containing protein n=1 Tax=Azospirillum formosense TaxID=861533 RepID=UPI00338F4233
MSAFEVSKPLSINGSDTSSPEDWEAIQPTNWPQLWLWLDCIPFAERAGHPPASGAVVAVAARLARHYNTDKGTCYPSVAKLSRDACVSSTMVRKALRWLISVSLITKTGRGKGIHTLSNLYRLTFPEWCVQFDSEEPGELNISKLKPELLKRQPSATPLHSVQTPLNIVHPPLHIVHPPLHIVPRNGEGNVEGKIEGNDEASGDMTYKLSAAGSLRSLAAPEISGPEEGSGESSGLKGEEQPAGSTLGAAAPHPASVCLPPGPSETPAGPAGVIDQEAAPQVEQPAASLAPLYADQHVQIIADAIKAWTKGDLSKPLVTRPGDNWRPAECQKIITLLNEQYQFGVEPSEANAEAIKPFVTKAQQRLLSDKIKTRK